MERGRVSQNICDVIQGRLLTDLALLLPALIPLDLPNCLRLTSPKFSAASASSCCSLRMSELETDLLTCV